MVPLPHFPLHDGSLLRRPLEEDMIAFDPAFGTRFTLFVDTEEEFDWNAPFSCTGHKVTAVSALKRGQQWFSRAGIKPVYVADYPVLDDPAASAALAEWREEDTADIGAHLHPWVNPPHVEELSTANSYVGFLPEGVEEAKLEALCARFEAAFGTRPTVYRAGRYGVGPRSARLLARAGFRLDSSVRSHFDYSAQHGPSFYGLPVEPYWAAPDRSLVELPLSTAFIGRLRKHGERLFRAAGGQGRFAGSLARLGLLSRVPLTPEGISAADAIGAIDALLDDGVRVLNFSFHSPTLEPGHTPYVRNAAELDDFYRWWGRVLEHLARRSVLPASIDEILGAVPQRAALGCQAA